MSKALRPATEVAAAETFWERAATTRSGRYLTAAERETLLSAATRAGDPGVAVDHGCEGGRWSSLLHDLGWTLVCVDVDADALAVCSRRLPDATCVLAEPSEPTIPVADSLAKLLVVFEVAPVSQRDWFVAEAARVLEPGGVLTCTYYNPTSARGLAYRVLRRLQQIVLRDQLRFHPDYYSGASYTHFRTVLHRAGFEVLREDGRCWFPFSRQSNSRLVPLATRLEALLGLRRVPTLSPFVLVVARKR